MTRRLMIGVLFGIVVYIGIIIWTGYDSIIEATRDFPLYLIPIALLLATANYLLRFFKWERYRKLLNIDLDQKTSFLIYLAGFSMGVTPGKMGEVFKSWLIRKVNGTKISYSAPIVVAERFTDLLGYLILVAIGGLATMPEYQWVFWATLGICAVALVLIGSEKFSALAVKIVSRTPYLKRMSKKVERSFATTRILLAPKELLFPTALSVVSWGCECTAFWLIADGMVDGDLDFLFAVFAYAFSAVAGAVLIIFPGGIGITEFTGGKLLRHKYMPLLEESGVASDVIKEVAQSKAAGAMLLTRFCTLWFAVIVGLIATALFRKTYGQVDGNETEEPDAL
ncbi:MAG: hypothetical protein ACI8TQ_000753 [Planctomycetota bacterium]|jgi:uncharacterized protein (TIRG00374 family)